MHPSTGFIPGMGSVNKRRYYVTPALIGRAHTWNYLSLPDDMIKPETISKLVADAMVSNTVGTNLNEQYPADPLVLSLNIPGEPGQYNSC